MSDHHLAQKRPALNSALQDELSQRWDAIRAWVMPRLIKRVRLVWNDPSKIRGKSRVPKISKPILLIPGKIDRGPSDGRSMVVVAADNGYTWEIRRYGSPVIAQGGNESFGKAEEAWNAGLIALDQHRAAVSGSSACSEIRETGRPAKMRENRTKRRIYHSERNPGNVGKWTRPVRLNVVTIGHAEISCACARRVTRDVAHAPNIV